MPPEQRRYLQYLRSLAAQASSLERIRHHLHKNSTLNVPQFRVLLFMLAYLEGQMACVARADGIPGTD